MGVVSNSARKSFVNWLADIPALLAISAADSGIIYLSAIQSSALCNSLDNGVGDRI